MEDLQSCRTDETYREKKTTENVHASERIKHANCVQGISTVWGCLLQVHRGGVGPSCASLFRESEEQLKNALIITLECEEVQ